MTEFRATTTIRALASLAEFSADQLEEGAPHDQVIETLRRAAEAVRLVIDADLEAGEAIETEDMTEASVETNTAPVPDLTENAFVPVLVELAGSETDQSSVSPALNAS